MRSVECVDRFPHIPHSSFCLFKLDEYNLKPDEHCDYRAVVTPLPHISNNVTAQR